ncbi:MAG TPA: trimeric intracellular cation channel family protein [Gemmatimonadaceae bacterium]|nr:trimeric intracellular cation channel family protein [Gemmatimonadaceae bacterium]
MLYALQILGVAAFAASGAIAAIRRGMDVIGVAVLAVVTAVGGGTVRDVILGLPVFWVKQPVYFGVCLIAAALIVLWMRFWKPPESSLGIADALGLGLFAIGGAQTARIAGVAPIIVILMGTITGVAGGILRDILSAEVPTVFRQGQLYATAAIIGITLYVSLIWLGLSEPVAAIVGMVTVVLIRFASVFWQIELPMPRVSSDFSKRND